MRSKRCFNETREEDRQKQQPHGPRGRTSGYRCRVGIAWEPEMDTHTPPDKKMDDRQGPAIQHRDLC